MLCAARQSVKATLSRQKRGGCQPGSAPQGIVPEHQSSPERGTSWIIYSAGNCASLSAEVWEEACENGPMRGTVAAKPSQAPSVAPHQVWAVLPLVTAIFLAARFAWLLNHAEELDAAPQIPLLILCELPLVVALVFITTKDKRRLAANGAGIAFAAALMTTLGVFPLSFVIGLGFVDRGTPEQVAALQRLLPFCFFGALLLLVFSFRHGRGQRRAFFLGFGIGIAYFFGAVTLAQSLAVPGSGALKEKIAYLGPSYSSPELHVRALMACVIRYRTLHPGSEFPASLAAIGPDWNCASDIGDPWAVSGYWIDYWRVNYGSDFRVEAVPVGNGRLGNPMPAGDGRGEVFSFLGLAPSRLPHAGGHVSVQTADAGGILGAVYGVRISVRDYMRAHDLVEAPPSLAGVIDPIQMPRNWCGDEHMSKDTLISGGGGLCYAVSYSPSAAPLDSFAVSVTCVSYGEGCIRSYFMDDDGTIHATPEPRPATAQDPELLPCEKAFGFYGPVCDDPVWTSSERASSLTFLRASLLYSIHTTKWW